MRRGVGYLAAILLLTSCRGRFDPQGSDSDAQDGSGDGGTGDPGRANVAFISSTRLTADFGGVAIADAECAARAKGANLDGVFIAMLGDSTAGPIDRLATSRGWVDTVGQPIVDRPEGWLDGGMWHPLERDESGTVVPYDSVWLGAQATNTCSDWTSITDIDVSIVTTRSVFGGFTISPCSNPKQIVCVEIGHDVALSHPVTPGRRTFMTVATFAANSGLAGADALCASEAASLGGTFLALLGTAAVDPWGRFSTAGPTWVRLDGVPLAPTAAEVAASGPDLSTFAIVRSDGSHYPYATHWVGSTTANCNNWGSAAINVQAAFGRAEYVQKSLWLELADTNCAQSLPITCVEP